MQKKINLLLLFFSLSFYGQNDTISVIRHTNKDSIVNKESKVVYRGILNSLSIEVPNCKLFTASAEGLKMISKNLFELNPGTGSEVIFTVEIILKNNKRITEKHSFRIKNLSGFLTSVNHIEGKLIKLQKYQLNKATLNVEPFDKNLIIKLLITRFVISLPNGKNIEINGNSISNDLFQIINKQVSKYDIITISDIQVTASNFLGCIRPAPIQIEIQ